MCARVRRSLGGAVRAGEGETVDAEEGSWERGQAEDLRALQTGLTVVVPETCN